MNGPMRRVTEEEQNELAARIGAAVMDISLLLLFNETPLPVAKIILHSLLKVVEGKEQGVPVEVSCIALEKFIVAEVKKLKVFDSTLN